MRQGAGKRIEVVEEDRTVTSTAGGFEDDFDALAEHVYHVRMW